MRILLDTKDLIDLVEHGKPVDLPEFAKLLQSSGAMLVLTITNVFEFAAPLVTTGDILKTRWLFRKIEQLPLTYMQIAGIGIEEVRSALTAFRSQSEFQRPNPYVARFDEAIVPGSPPTSTRVGYGLWDAVHDVWRYHPEVIRAVERYGEQLRALFAADRDPAVRRDSLARNFENTVAKTLQQASLDSGDVDLAEFAHWIWEEPRRCPGLRLGYETYHKMLKNTADTPKDGDISDLSHVRAIPYVEAATLDRRMTAYVSQAIQNLEKTSPHVRYSDRVFDRLDALLKSKGLSQDG